MEKDKEIINESLSSVKAWESLAQSMVEPIRRAVKYQSVARSIFKTRELSIIEKIELKLEKMRKSF